MNYNYEPEKDIKESLLAEIQAGRVKTYDDLLYSDYVTQAHDLHIGIDLLIKERIPNAETLEIPELLSELIHKMTSVFQAYPNIWVADGRFIAENEPADCDFLIRFPMTASNTPAQSMWEFEYQNGTLRHGPCGDVSFEPRQPVCVVYESSNEWKYPNLTAVEKTILKKGGSILETKTGPRDRYITRIQFRYQDQVYQLYYLNQCVGEGEQICGLVVSDGRMGFLQARQWFQRPSKWHHVTKKLNMMMHRSGSNSISPRISIPSSWAMGLGVTLDDRSVDVSYTGEEIIISKETVL